MDYEDMLEKGREEIPEDVFENERFEIPEAETQKDGSKTIIRNFKKIAATFGRDQTHLSKFLLGEMGTAGHIDGGELILNGNFRRGAINRKIKEYADTFVLCSECGKPDTKKVKEKGIELLKCEACGARTPIDD
jgi:translation initiation factor 2 subunit 2